MHGLGKLFPIDELRCTCLNIRALDARAPMEPRRERVFGRGMDWEHSKQPNKFTQTCELEGLAKAMVDALLPRKEVDPEEVLRKHASKAFGVTWP